MLEPTFVQLFDATLRLILKLLHIINNSKLQQRINDSAKWFITVTTLNKYIEINSLLINAEFALVVTI